MSITLNKLERDITNIATSGQNPDDFRISPRQIYHWINEIRSMLISQAIQKRQDITDVWVQTLSCIKLIKIDKSECCLNISNCLVLRSEKKIPRTVEFDGDNLIITVLGSEGKTISKYNKHSSRYSKYRKYTSNRTGWFLKDDYLWIINDNLIDNIVLYAIFEDPSDLNSYSCCDKPCFTIDSEYPVSMKMASMITDIILKTKVNALLSYPQDKLNDSNSESKPQGK